MDMSAVKVPAEFSLLERGKPVWSGRRNSLGFPLAISSSRIIYFLQSIPQNASISGNPFLSPKVVESRMDSRKIS
jgi:hypothetical protein